jgi:hypothetical protein
MTKDTGIRKVSKRRIRAKSRKVVGVATTVFLSFNNEKNCRPEKFNEI